MIVEHVGVTVGVEKRPRRRGDGEEIGDQRLRMQPHRIRPHDDRFGAEGAREGVDEHRVIEAKRPHVGVAECPFAQDPGQKRTEAHPQPALDEFRVACERR